MDSKYKRGDMVAVQPYGSHKWVNAVVSQPAPYPGGKCDGAYATYDPLPKNSFESSGGWFPDRAIRARDLEVSHG